MAPASGNPAERVATTDLRGRSAPTLTGEGLMGGGAGGSVTWQLSCFALEQAALAWLSGVVTLHVLYLAVQGHCAHTVDFSVLSAERSWCWHLR